jgi:hypothetical protein
MLLYATGASAAPALSVRWSGARPDRVYIQTSSGEKEVDYNSAQKVYVGQFPPAAKPFARWTIIAVYGSDAVPILLNVDYSQPKVEFTLPRPAPPTACNKFAVARVEKAQDNPDGSLRSALEARMLTAIPSPDDCDLALRRRTVIARAERMLELAKRAPYFAVDPQLLAEARQFKSAYAALQQAAGLEAKAMYDRQLEALADGQLELAAKVNDQMQERLKAEPLMAEAFETQKIGLGRLVADQALLSARIGMGSMEAQGPQSR